MSDYRSFSLVCLLALIAVGGGFGCPGLFGDLADHEFEGDAGDANSEPLSCEEGETVCSNQCVDVSVGVRTGDAVEHCGGCDNTCDDPPHGSAVCDGGSCDFVCGSDREACDGECIDVSSDPENCGGCETSCDEEDVCSGGECLDECPADETDCDGACVDTESHVEHCGECGNGCDDPAYGSAICAGGSCDIECDDAEGIERCGDQCVDTDVGVETTNGFHHCGGCENDCMDTETKTAFCDAGSCEFEEIDQLLGPWAEGMHEGDIHVQHWVDEATVDWPSQSGQQVLYMTTDPEANLLAPGEPGVEVVSNAQPGHTFDGLTPGETVYFGLEVDDDFHSWTAARPNYIGFDNDVHDITVDPDTGIRYVGGQFRHVVTSTGSGVTVPTEPIKGAHVLGYPEVRGPVFAAAPDGDGGWYIGGRFSHVGGEERKGLAHIDASGRVTDWAPEVDSSGHSGAVDALEVAGDRIYVGGAFDSATSSSSGSGPQVRYNLAAFDTNGDLIDWNPGTDYPVNTLALDGDVIYASGSFGTVGQGTSSSGETDREHLAAFTPDGEVTDWDPDWSLGTLDTVHDIAIDGDTIFVGGSFETTSPSGQHSRESLAAFDTDGALVEWDAEISADVPWVRALAIEDGVVYVGGNFDAAGSEEEPRTNLAAFNTDGGLTDWATGVTRFGNLPGDVEVLTVDDGVIYAGGDFDEVGFDAAGGESQPRGHVAAFDTEGELLEWDPGLGKTGLTPVSALSISDGLLYIGGEFQSAGQGTTGGGGKPRANVAAFGSDGALLDWDPGVDSGSTQGVRSLAIDNGIIYAGGRFDAAGTGTTASGRQTRDYLAAFDTEGKLTDWDPGSESWVNAVAIYDDIVYIGGSFDEVGTGASTSAVSRQNLAAFDKEGNVTDWDAETNGSVYALAVDDGVFYAGGSFSKAGTGGDEQDRLSVAAFDTNGELLEWDPGVDSSSFSVSVETLVAKDGIIYAGGDFTEAGMGTTGGGTTERDFLAAFDTDGQVTSWSPRVAEPDFSLDSPVIDIAIDGDVIYVGGTFNTAGLSVTGTGGEPRQSVAAFDVDGQLTDWDPGAPDRVYTISPYGGEIYVGGKIGTAGGGTTGGGERIRSNFAVFDENGMMID